MDQLEGALFLAQPPFIPWLPYFSRTRAASISVIVDNQKYKRHYFHNRALVPSNNSIGYRWITIPVSGNSSQETRDVVISSGGQKACIKSYEGNLSRRDREDVVIDAILRRMHLPTKYLLDLNIGIIQDIYCALYGTSIELHLASSLSNAPSTSEIARSSAEKFGLSYILGGWGGSRGVFQSHGLGDLGLRMITQRPEALERALAPAPLEISIAGLCQIFGSQVCRDRIDEFSDVNNFAVWEPNP